MYKFNSRSIYIFASLLATALCWSACSSNGPLAVFKKLSPHDEYAQRLKDAGLHSTAMGAAWITKAEAALVKPLAVTLPYKETGYFAADKTDASVLRFDAKRGQQLRVQISKKPVANFTVYADLLQLKEPGKTEVVASTDTVGAAINYEIKQTGTYILRLQPELLTGGEYTLSITTGPSLGFPVSAVGKPRIGSFWGDGRDHGGRQHEGIDIFAPKGTPAIATNNGTVSRVTDNALGGKVVFFRPADRDYNLYYAHLDAQLVQDGQQLRAGDTIGLVGNTGNARTTPAHLHFGVYTNNGAVDPLPFVNREVKQPANVRAPLESLNATVRSSRRAKLSTSADQSATIQTLAVNTPLLVKAASAGMYKIALPNGAEGFVASADVENTTTLRRLTLKAPRSLRDAPDTTAARKTLISPGNQVEVLANYESFQLVKYKGDTGWILE